MGSEGYLINEFIAPRTNKRADAWGGDARQRMRFAVEIVRRIREACGPDFIIIYRLSLVDLVDDGSDWDEIVQQAQAIGRLAQRSSIPASAGTKRAFRPSPPRCRARPLPASPPSSSRM